MGAGLGGGGWWDWGFIVGHGEVGGWVCEEFHRAVVLVDLEMGLHSCSCGTCGLGGRGGGVRPKDVGVLAVAALWEGSTGDYDRCFEH